MRRKIKKTLTAKRADIKLKLVSRGIAVTAVLICTFLASALITHISPHKMEAGLCFKNKYFEGVTAKIAQIYDIPNGKDVEYSYVETITQDHGRDVVSIEEFRDIYTKHVDCADFDHLFNELRIEKLEFEVKKLQDEYRE